MKRPSSEDIDLIIGVVCSIGMLIASVCMAYLFFGSF